MYHSKTAAAQIGTKVRIRKVNVNTGGQIKLNRILKQDEKGFYVDFKNGKVRLEETVLNVTDQSYYDLKEIGFEAK